MAAFEEVISISSDSETAGSETTNSETDERTEEWRVANVHVSCSIAWLFLLCC